MFYVINEYYREIHCKWEKYNFYYNKIHLLFILIHYFKMHFLCHKIDSSLYYYVIRKNLNHKKYKIILYVLFCFLCLVLLLLLLLRVLHSFSFAITFYPSSFHERQMGIRRDLLKFWTLFYLRKNKINNSKF